jgi:hypothetical protein
MHATDYAQPRMPAPARMRFGGGPKGPPSAPPTIPPIIINPFTYGTPSPAIDPRVLPPGPPLMPPRQPDMRM